MAEVPISEELAVGASPWTVAASRKALISAISASQLTIDNETVSASGRGREGCCGNKSMGVRRRGAPPGSGTLRPSWFGSRVTAPAADWTAPGAHPVAPGVHRIPLPMPNDALRAVNVYAIDGGPEGGVSLVDAGWALSDAEDVLEAALDSIGYAIPDIRRILVTHAHRDHYTLGVVLKRKFGTRLAIGIGEQPNIERAIAETGSEAARLLPTWGAQHLAAQWTTVYTPTARLAQAATFDLPDEWIADGADLDAGTRTLTAIRTPGHTQGHLVFADPAGRVLFTGDHVLPHITPSIGFEPVRAVNPLGDFLSSLQLLLTHPDSVMLPAHGPVADSVHQRVHELIAHHDVRLADTLAAVKAGSGTAYGTAQRLGWTRRATPFDELTIFNQVLAIGETNYHLRLLAERREITRTVDAGTGLEIYEAL